MAISITLADVKRKAMIEPGSTAHDTSITALISEMQPAIEHSIADCHLDDTADSGLQAVLKLGILEIVAGEYIEQLRRQPGAAEEFSIAGVSIGASQARGTNLVEQGAARLSPYLKAALPMLADTWPASSTTCADTAFSREEEVW